LETKKKYTAEEVTNQRNNSQLQEEEFTRSMHEILERITIPSGLSEMFIGELPLETEEEEENDDIFFDDEEDPKKKRKREEEKKKKEQEKKKKQKEKPLVHQLVYLI
jgi:hypothetical protein